MQVADVSVLSGMNLAPAAPAAPSAQRLDQDDFLRLLMAQLGNQDPLEPVSNTEFISQMAQFTALSQTGQMANSLNRLESASQLEGAASLLGREVTLQDGTTGLVREVYSREGIHWLNLGDRLVTLDEVAAFRSPASGASPTGEAGKALDSLGRRALSMSR